MIREIQQTWMFYLTFHLVLLSERIEDPDSIYK